MSGDEPDRTVYRSKRPEVVALWAKFKESAAVFDRAINAFLEAHAPAGAKAMTVDTWGAQKLAGITVVGDAGKPPSGWRLDRKNWILVPFRSTVAGKRVSEALDAVVLPDVRAELPGMPSWDLHNIAVRHPGIEIHDGAMYVLWGGGPPEGVDPDIWEPVPLSEYYAVKEAAA